SFMAGYAKSVLSDPSATLPELVVALGGAERPAVAYKAYVLVATASVPWLLACAGLLFRARPDAIAAAVVLFGIYLWTDFPLNYASLGMVAYLLAIPLGLVTTGTLVAFLRDGGLGRWLAAVAASIAVFLVHLTSAMVVAPAAALAYGVAVVS